MDRMKASESGKRERLKGISTHPQLQTNYVFILFLCCLLYLILTHQFDTPKSPNSSAMIAGHDPNSTYNHSQLSYNYFSEFECLI
jgi:hypothetical protein